VNTIQQKSGLMVSWVIILMMMFGAGCLGTDQHPLKTDVAPVQCSEYSVAGHDMIINETQNNATICASLNSTVIVQLKDSSRTGREWFVTASPGLQIEDNGVTWYDEPGVPPVSLIEFGIHQWNVTMKDKGVQKIQAVLKFPGREVSGSGQTFDLTIVVN